MLQQSVQGPSQAYKIHGTVGPPVPEKNWPRKKLTAAENFQNWKKISEKNENVNIS